MGWLGSDKGPPPPPPLGMSMLTDSIFFLMASLRVQGSFYEVEENKLKKKKFTSKGMRKLYKKGKNREIFI